MKNHSLTNRLDDSALHRPDGADHRHERHDCDRRRGRQRTARPSKAPWIATARRPRPRRACGLHRLLADEAVGEIISDQTHSMDLNYESIHTKNGQTAGPCCPFIHSPSPPHSCLRCAVDGQPERNEIDDQRGLARLPHPAQRKNSIANREGEEGTGKRDRSNIDRVTFRTKKRRRPPLS